MCSIEGKDGLLIRLKTYLKRNKLGELLVSSGTINPKQLKQILKVQKQENKPLGQILVAENLVGKNQLRYLLLRQTCLRFAATAVFCVASMGSYKKLQAETVHDVPASISVSVTGEFERVAKYPALFGTGEKRHRDLSEFVKWTGMFKRFERAVQSRNAQRIITQWREELKDMDGGSIKTMATKVNDFINEQEYILDKKNWGKSDYWATPVEFFKRGGDCEDFAIAKYASLRALGVPENRLRLAIVHDSVKNIPHAVLVVYTNQGPYVLDNQIKKLIDGDKAGRYRPIYSINREAWWLHTKQKGSVIASADRY